MSSFFNPICSIFWITWISGLAILLACFSFRLENTYSNNDLDNVMSILVIVCWTNIAVALVGCIFVKCNVHHACCAGLFMISCGLVTPALSIWGAVVTRQTVEPNVTTTLQLAKEYFRKYQKFPQWLVTAEQRLDCCGLSGPFYYRELFRTIPNCQRYICDVPPSCVVRTDKTDRSGVLAVSQEMHMNQALCASNQEDAWRAEVFQVYNLTNIAEKCVVRKAGEGYFDFVDNKLKRKVYKKSCYQFIKSSFVDLSEFIFYCCLFLCFCSLIMLFGFGRFFCKSSTITGERSNYSLDMEATSLLDVPNSDWTAGKRPSVGPSRSHKHGIANV